MYVRYRMNEAKIWEKIPALVPASGPTIFASRPLPRICGFVCTLWTRRVGGREVVEAGEEASTAQLAAVVASAARPARSSPSDPRLPVVLMPTVRAKVKKVGGTLSCSERGGSITTSLFSVWKKKTMTMTTEKLLLYQGQSID